MSKRRWSPEVRAIAKMYELLSEFDYRTQRRILTYLTSRTDSDHARAIARTTEPQEGTQGGDRG